LPIGSWPARGGGGMHAPYPGHTTRPRTCRRRAAPCCGSVGGPPAWSGPWCGTHTRSTPAPGSPRCGRPRATAARQGWHTWAQAHHVQATHAHVEGPRARDQRVQTRKRGTVQSTGHRHTAGRQQRVYAHAHIEAPRTRDQGDGWFSHADRHTRTHATASPSHTHAHTDPPELAPWEQAHHGELRRVPPLMPPHALQSRRGVGAVPGHVPPPRTPPNTQSNTGLWPVGANTRGAKLTQRPLTDT
jgi:hypothetical protein